MCLCAHICLLSAGRDLFLVTKLNKLDSKLDSILQIISKFAADNTPTQPELPDDITLPVSTLQQLEAVEAALAQHSALKDSLVSFVFKL